MTPPSTVASKRSMDSFHPKNHPLSCAYHVDQYPHECTCGQIPQPQRQGGRVVTGIQDTKPDDPARVLARVIREEIVRQQRDDERNTCPGGAAFYEETVGPYLIARAVLASLFQHKDEANG